MMAKQKLQSVLENEENKSFANPIINYLLGVCDSDPEFAECVLQEHKTWEKCQKYIYDLGKERAKSENPNIQGQVVYCIDNDIVYKWAEDYFRKDDKAEEEAKAKEEAERKAKAEAEAKEKAKAAKKKKSQKPAEKQTISEESKPAEEQKKEPVVRAKPRTRKKAEEVNNNALTIFDLM